MNIVLVLVIALLLIPQTRKPIQIALHSLLAKFGPSVVDEDERTTFEFQSWELQDLNETKIDLNDLEGKVVFLNFWATWCPPCIAEFPSLQELHSDYSDKIEFVLISNEDPDVTKAFFDKKGYTFNSYTPLSDYPDNLQIRSIPRTFLIDMNGKIVIDKSGAANWNSTTMREQLDALLTK